MGFKIGDKVTGVDRSAYSKTTSDAVMRVVEIYSRSTMRVEILKHKTTPAAIGKSYGVEQCYFKLIKVELENK